MKPTTTLTLLAVYATTSHAWGTYDSSDDGSTSSTSSNPYSSSSGSDSSSDYNDSSFSYFYGFSLSSNHKKLVAHAVLATFAFGFLFPALHLFCFLFHSRLGNFRGLWIVHGLCQLFAYITYIAAVGLGLFVSASLSPSLPYPDMQDN